MKSILPLVAVFGLLLTSSATARQWTSRNGGFSVEAELVDVKDGNVILKKTDGSQTTVPLNKLSLGDVQYIGEVLKAAEAGITGGKIEAPAVEKQKPQEVPAPERLKPADMSKLAYQWKKGQTYVYRVRILGDRGHDIENRSGNVTYKVKSIQHDEITLSVTSDIKRETARIGRRYVLVPGQHVGFLSDFDGKKEISITVNPTGRLLESRGEAPLPYLLGDLSELIVEPLTQPQQATWTVSGDPGVAVVSPHYPYCRISMAGFREGVPAVEKTDYTVEGQAGKLITIAKRYEMTTAAAIAGKPRLEATGEGKLKFDTDRRVFDSLDFKMRVVVRDSNKTEETPIQISYRLLSEEDMAAAKKDAEEEKKEAEKAKKEKNKPLTDSEIETALADLASDDTEQISNSTKLLGEKKPQQPNPKIAKALELVMLNSENVGLRAQAAAAMKNWSTSENVPALTKALGDAWAPVRAAAIESLCKYAPKSAVKQVSQQLTDGFTRGPAVKFLKAIGPDAEDAVLAHIEHTDPWTRAEVCAILGVIGTKKSLPALQKAVADDNWMVNGNARKALAAIKSRE